jgi:hypothetical protein
VNPVYRPIDIFHAFFSRKINPLNPIIPRPR